MSESGKKVKESGGTYKLADPDRLVVLLAVVLHDFLCLANVGLVYVNLHDVT